MAIGDVYRITVVFNQVSFNESQTTSFHIDQNALTAPQLGDVAPVVVDWWNTGLGGTAQKTFHTDEIQLAKIQMQRIQPFEPVIQEFITGLPISGTAAGDMGAPASCALVSKRTAKAGRRFRGRSYLPTLAEGFLDPGGSITTVNAQAIADTYLNMVQGINGIIVGDPTFVVWSQVAVQQNPVTSIKVDRFVRNQRRRNSNTRSYVTAV